MEAMIESIKSLTCKKHIKIYKLKQVGLSNKQVAEMCGTNVGHVHNVMKDYSEKPEKVKVADAIQLGQ